jgi:oligoribonuclease
MKYVSIDIETTGRRRSDPENMDNLLSIGMVIDDLEHPEVPVGNLPKLHLIIDVSQEVITGELEALIMHTMLLRKIEYLSTCDSYKEYVPYVTEYFISKDDAIKYIQEFLQYHKVETPLTIAGKNVMEFDIQFLNNAIGFDKSIEYNFGGLDPAIYFLDESVDTCMPTLSECKERAGLDGPAAHQALEDAIDIVKLIRIGRLKCHN